MALSAAIVKGECSRVALEALKERGLADIHWRDKDGRTALHYAASYGAVDALEWLVEQGGEVEARQQDGTNVLHAAASEGQCGVVEWLNAKGGVKLLQRLLGETGEDGQNAHQLALANGHSLFARLLEELALSSPPSGGSHSRLPENGVEGGLSSSLSGGLPLPPRRSIPAAVSTGRKPPPGPPPPPQSGQGRPNESDSNDGLHENNRDHGATTTAGGGGGGGGGGGATMSSGFTVSSAWSVAGVGTCIQVTHRSFGLHVAFDMGTSAAEALNADHVFISHSHIDHIGAVLPHARARTLSNKPATYYVPEAALSALLQAKEAYEALDGNTFIGKFMAVKPGDVIRIHPNIKAVVFPTVHRMPSQGYALIREKSRGLKAEYRDLPPRELGSLRKQGVQVADVEDIVEVAYTGDTLLAPLLTEPFVTSARLLIMECTYLGGDERDVEAAHKWQHIHLQELVSHADAFHQNESIILCHVSQKHGPADRILRLLQTALPPSLLSRVGVTLSAFGRQEPVTNLEAFLHELMG